MIVDRFVRPQESSGCGRLGRKVALLAAGLLLSAASAAQTRPAGGEVDAIHGVSAASVSGAAGLLGTMKQPAAPEARSAPLEPTELPKPAAFLAAASRPVPVPVLIYHQIVTEPTRARPLGETVVTIEQFAEQMRYLATHGYTTIGLDELARYMRSGGPMPDRPVVLTFDDGWKSALRAVPLLDRYGFKASFWIIAGPRGIGGPYMDWTDIERLAANPRYEIGSHTVSHPWHLADNLVAWTQPGADAAAVERARREIVDAKRVLERRLRREVNALAWPRGWYNESLVRMAREAGYTMLLTTLDGLNAPGDDLLRVKRTFVYGECDLASFARSLHEGEDRVCRAARRVTQGHLPPQLKLSRQPGP